MDALIDAMQHLVRTRDLTVLRKALVKAARKLTNSDGANVILQTGQQYHCVEEDAIEPLYKEQTLSALTCPAHECCTHQQAIVIENLATHTGVSFAFYGSTFVASLMMVPVTGQHALGALGVYWAKPYQVTPQTLQVLTALADCAAIAMENIGLYEQLNARVLERTTALYEAQQLAEQANATKSRFLATASHDLRQPLQQLSMLSGILCRGTRDSNLHQYATKMQTVIGSVEQMLSALLDLDQLESGKLTAHYQDFPLEQLLHQLRADFSEAATHKRLTLVIPACQKQVYSDPHLLLQILRNFVSNAIKYTAQGTVRLLCHTVDNLIEISVQDSGSGIPQDQQQAIFDAFYQIKNAGQRQQRQSFGLGLAVVKGLAELLNYPLFVESSDGNGTVFKVRVPRSEADHEALINDSDALLETAAAYKANVLYLEDNQELVDAVTALLEMEGYQVWCAESGDEALALCAKSDDTPDLIVTDNSLANGDNGLEVVQRMRALAGREIPAIMLTGHTEKAMHEHALQTVQTVLCKPIDADILLANMDQLLLMHH